MKLFLKITAAVLVFLTVLSYFYIVLPFWGMPFNGQRHTRPPKTPAWALECWLWEDDVGTAERVDELLAGYADHDIPVRTILIDSPWSYRYNDFDVDTTRYPKPEKWFTDLQDRGYRVVLWMTSMVNSRSKDTSIPDSHYWFNEAAQNNFLAGDGYQMRWWKGTGGFIDYTNPTAMQWWRRLQQTVFDYGIDGWKLDGTATFFSGKLFGIPVPYQRTHGGWKTTRQYMDHYYRDEYAHSLTQNPEFVTLARSIDRPFTHPEGFAPLDAAPVTWVGDQRHSWKSSGIDDDGSFDDDLVMQGDEGIEEALRDILLAAELGYCIIGSDIGGFSGRVIPPRLYMRWAQLSAFCGLFMNGGHGERALWKRSEQELQVIRKFSWLHTELIPYIYSHMVVCHQGGEPLQRPVAGKYHYLFGDDFLIAPIYQDDLSSEVQLPAGKWFYFFDDSQVYTGPVTFRRDFPMDEYPVFIRAGAIVPMQISRTYTGIGDQNSDGFLTLLVYPDGNQTYTIYHPDGKDSTTISTRHDGHQLKIDITGRRIAHILRIHSVREPGSVLLANRNIPFKYDDERKKIFITTSGYDRSGYSIRYD